jgi:hypothetical protein
MHLPCKNGHGFGFLFHPKNPHHHWAVEAQNRLKEVGERVGEG